MLYLDIGNTKIKVKSFRDKSWYAEYSGSVQDVENCAGFLLGKNQPVTGISVVNPARKVLDETDGINIEWLTHKSIPTQSLDYETPETLGMDRYMACLGACVKAKKAVIVIDAGTACTIDYMDESGIFRGGVIMPGISLWEKALRENAPALPEVVRDVPGIWPGKNTERSVRWGLTGAFVEAVNGMVRKYDHLASVWVTGGDADWLAKRIERSAKVDSNIVFDGMQKLAERKPWFG